MTAASAEAIQSPAPKGFTRRLAKVRHTNVLSVYGADLIDGQLGFWTEFIKGETLESLLDRESADQNRFGGTRRFANTCSNRTCS